MTVMSFQDLLTVERAVAELCSAMGVGSVPVMLPRGFARVDIDVRTWRRHPERRQSLRAALARRLADEGRLWDVWPSGETKLCVSAREEEEE